jgi:hypothetical protein
MAQLPRSSRLDSKEMMLAARKTPAPILTIALLAMLVAGFNVDATGQAFGPTRAAVAGGTGPLDGTELTCAVGNHDADCPAISVALEKEMTTAADTAALPDPGRPDHLPLDASRLDLRDHGRSPPIRAPPAGRA